MLQYKNHLQYNEKKTGKERQLELLSDILENGTFFPKTVTYKDIDSDFKRWVEKELVITNEDGKEFPTIALYSNQRFSEYNQTWGYTDNDNNLLLNFKSISRDNNPEYGKIQNGLWNIPGKDRYYLMKRQLVLDDNGSESILDLKMKQPVAIDFNYKLSVFTTKYESINEFNALINKVFSARQCYIRPNDHFMPMILDSINDESEYSIDDRQFYSQTYNIKIMGYIITENDFIAEERPLKIGISLNTNVSPTLKADVEITTEEIDTCNEPYNPYYYKPTVLTVKYPKCVSSVKFTIDDDFNATDIELSNVLNNFKIKVNNEAIDNKKDIKFKKRDEIKINITRRHINDEAIMVFNGYSPSTVYDERKDDLEFEEDNTQFEEDVIIEA